jgi:hypothetical protein
MKSLKIPKKIVTRSHRSKTERQCNGKGIRTKGPIGIYKKLHRKLKIEHHEPHWKQEENPGVPNSLIRKTKHNCNIVGYEKGLTRNVSDAWTYQKGNQKLKIQSEKQNSIEKS